MAVTVVDFDRPGPWRDLWPQALALMSHLENVTTNPPWTFGGRDSADAALRSPVQHEPAAIDIALPYMERHAGAFLKRLNVRAETTENEFNQIEARSFRKSFWECVALAHVILDPLVR